MKNLFIGLIATGFMTLSSFTTLPTTKTVKTADDVWCCTATGGGYYVTFCGNYPCTNAKAILKAHLATL